MFNINILSVHLLKLTCTPKQSRPNYFKQLQQEQCCQFGIFTASWIVLLSHCGLYFPPLFSLGDEDRIDGIQLWEDECWHGTARPGRCSQELQKEQALRTKILQTTVTH